MVDWLDFWESVKHYAGHLIRVRHTLHAVSEVTRYCIEKLGFSYGLLGKFQTDSVDYKLEKSFAAS
ncbi:hypothetical protein HPB48_006133 [Haemaphysalis longicornis]|uniref:Uncharacterized protein n=1 Tax=Haemaphysalis longicornis TaxID=44386 RepID=A0A9J6H112_HAELO|nr:hypothetical protein HPB48_006133 [Haemaphysalis longicornis]